MKRTCALLLGLAGALVFAASAAAYDAEGAAAFARLFAAVQGEKAGKALHLIPPDAFVERIKKGEHLVALDIRTPAETRIYGMTLPATLAIPLHTLFAPENLARIPTDRTVLVVCKSDTRATAAATALRFIGFDNVYVLKGGLKGLTDYLDATTANMPPEKPQ